MSLFVIQRVLMLGVSATEASFEVKISPHHSRVKHLSRERSTHNYVLVLFFLFGPLLLALGSHSYLRHGVFRTPLSKGMSTSSSPSALGKKPVPGTCRPMDPVASLATPPAIFAVAINTMPYEHSSQPVHNWNGNECDTRVTFCDHDMNFAFLFRPLPLILLSGMMVQDPTHKNNRDVDSIFDRARQIGARERIEAPPAPSNRGAFSGQGRTLSGAVPQQGQTPSAPSPPVFHTITFWRNGFTVDDGPLRRLDDPANAPFLAVPPEPKYVAFQGIRGFIDAARPGHSGPYSLQSMGFPPKQLSDSTQTIEQAGLINAVVIQK
ncbi:unnamed protein product [Calypogeia fissa]